MVIALPLSSPFWVSPPQPAVSPVLAMHSAGVRSPVAVSRSRWTTESSAFATT